MSAESCPFCLIVTANAADQVFYADADVIALLDTHPATPGHTLVIPRRHADDIFDIPEDDFAAVSRGAHRVAQRLLERLKPDGLSIIQSNRPAGWQEVFHLHLHLLPRYLDDGLAPPWDAAQTDPGSLQALTAMLR